MARRTSFVFINCILLLLAATTALSEDAQIVEQLDFANGLFQRGLYNMAVSEYKKFVSQFPESDLLEDAYFGIAEGYFFDANYSEAIKAFSGFNDKYPTKANKAFAGLRIGQSLFFQKKYKEALETLSKVNEGDLSREFKQLLYYYMAKSYNEQGDPGESIKYLNACVSVSEHSEYAVNALLDLAALYAKKKDAKKAVSYYGEVIKGQASDEIKVFALSKKGELLFDQGYYQESSKQFEIILKDYKELKDPVGVLTNYVVGLFRLSRYKDITDTYVEHSGMITEGPESFDLRFISCRAYLKQSLYQQGLVVIDKMLSFEWLRGENLHIVLLKKLELLLKMDEYDKVLDLARDGDFLDEKDRDYVLFVKAEALYGLKRFMESYEAYESVTLTRDSVYFEDAIYGMAYSKKSVGDDQEAAEYFLRYYETGNDPAKKQEAVYNAMLIKNSLGRKDEAIKLCNDYIEKFEEGQFREKVLMVLGALYSELGRYKEAAATYKDFVEKHKDSKSVQEAYFKLGYNLQMSDREDEALSYYKKIAQTDKSDLYYSSLKNSALIYLRKDSKKKAAVHFDKLITDFPKNDLDPDAYLWLAKYYLKAKKYDDALRILLKTEKKASGQRAKEIAYFRGEVYREKKLYDNAISEYDKVLSDVESDMFTGGAYIGKALSFIGKEDFEAAKKDLEIAILEFPDDNTITMRARFELANIQDVTGNREEASKLYMLIAILYNDDYYAPNSLYYAGQVFEKMDKKDEAVKVYKELTTRFKKHDAAKKAKERLRVIHGE